MNSERTGDKDYYLILGVAPTASASDITAAYHLLARKYHPDSAATDSATLSLFKQINEAYEVLSNEERRRDYDRRSGRGGRPIGNGFEFVPVSKQKTTFVPLTPNLPAGGALDVEAELPVRPEELQYGGPCEFTVTVPIECERCGGITNLPCSICGGVGRVGEQRHLRVNLPRGMRTGSLVRIAGLGLRSVTRSGDLVVRIRVLPYW